MKMIALGFLAAFVTPTAITQQGCTLVCTDVGVVPGAQVRVSTAVQGAYEIEVAGEGDTVIVRVALGTEPTCDTACTASGAALRVDFVGAASGGFDVLVGNATGWGAPATFAVRIRRDGVLVHESTLMPQYRESCPNGEGCGCGKVTEQPIVLTPS